MAKKDQVIDPNIVNRIAPSTEIKGDFTTETDIKLDGKFEGKITTKNKFVLGQEGTVKGEVYCKNAVIGGRIEGKIFVEEMITLQSTAHIEGDIQTDQIAIEPGAVFNGTCKMGEHQNKTIDK